MATMKAIQRYGGSRDVDVMLQANEEHELFIAQGRSAAYTEITRGNEVWSLISAAATPLVVIPTTLCILEVHNPAYSKFVFEVLDLFLFHLLGTAAVHNQSIWAEVTPPKAAPTVATLVIGSHSGRESYTAALGSPIVPGAGTTVVAAGWRPYGQPGSGLVSTALPGEAFAVPVDGKLLVPPGCSLAITCVDALATASSVQVGATINLRKLTMA